MRVLRASVPKPRRLVRDRHALVLKPVFWRLGNQTNQPEHQASNARIILSYVLIVAGGTLCIYVAGTYTWMYARQRALLHEWNAHNPAVVQNLTKISIPRIDLEDVVLEGTSAHSLLLGPGHLTGSAEPGSPGNAVIAGHRDSFFRRIHSLRYGDEVIVMRGAKKVRYVVSERKIVKPGDLSVLRPSNDTRLTLITCYPTHAIGPAPRRLIVIAKLASGT